jgi:hypothetical protein
MKKIFYFIPLIGLILNMFNIKYVYEFYFFIYHIYSSLILYILLPLVLLHHC